MPGVFHPDHSALDQLFAKETSYIIPEYQRPYSWQSEGKSDRNNQINQMWEDLWTFFREQEKDKEYFLGSMVIIEAKLRKREVVDGQQRLTSLLLLFTAMRCFLQHLSFDGDDAESAELSTWANRGINKLREFVYNEQSFGLAPDLKVKIDRSAGYDFGHVLELATDCKGKEELPAVDSKYREIAYRYFDNRDYFLARLKNAFLSSETFGVAEAQVFDRFFTFLQTRVAIVLIKTIDFDTAYSIFGILNNRGLPLSNVDLFRNLALNEFAKHGLENGADRWYRLEDDYVLTEDFMGRWVESLLGTKYRKSAFNAIKDRYDKDYQDSPIQTKIERLYADLERDLSYYSMIVEADLRLEDVGVRNSIKFIAQLGNQRYSTNFLLSLFRTFTYRGGVPPQGLSSLLQAYERYALWLLLRPGRRFSSERVFQAMRQLGAGRPEEAQRQFALTDEEKKVLAEDIDGPIETNDTARLLLAAQVWQAEAAADDVVAQSLSYRKATLEHILPISPADGTNWLRDFSEGFRKHYTHRLGNMTLLTRRMNSRLKNHDFANKRAEYRKTRLAMTTELAALDTISEDFIKARHQRLVSALCTRWTLPAVAPREAPGE